MFNIYYRVKTADQRIKNIFEEMPDDLHEESKAREISSQNEMGKVTEDFPIGTTAQVASGSELLSSQVNTNQSIS